MARAVRFRVSVRGEGQNEPPLPKDKPRGRFVNSPVGPERAADGYNVESQAKKAGIAARRDLYWMSYVEATS